MSSRWPSDDPGLRKLVRDSAIEQGLCGDCRQKNPVVEFVLCPCCREKRATRRRNVYARGQRSRGGTWGSTASID